MEQGKVRLFLLNMQTRTCILCLREDYKRLLLESSKGEDKTVLENLLQNIPSCERLPVEIGPCSGTGKKKRKPSRYNLFMGRCIKEKTGPVTQRFKECALEYKKKKNT